jgi:hypothetical protein
VEETALVGDRIVAFLGGLVKKVGGFVKKVGSAIRSAPTRRRS